MKEEELPISKACFNKSKEAHKWRDTRCIHTQRKRRRRVKHKRHSKGSTWETKMKMERSQEAEDVRFTFLIKEEGFDSDEEDEDSCRDYHEDFKTIVQDYLQKLRYATELTFGTLFSQVLCILQFKEVPIPELECKYLALELHLEKFSLYRAAGLLRASSLVETLNISIENQPTYCEIIFVTLVQFPLGWLVFSPGYILRLQFDDSRHVDVSSVVNPKDKSDQDSDDNEEDSYGEDHQYSDDEEESCSDYFQDSDYDQDSYSDYYEDSDDMEEDNPDEDEDSDDMEEDNPDEDSDDMEEDKQ
uniref:KS1 protein n=1 Tax=Solanum tuberosum TaxID=4113 RepID=M1A6X1_SOLTU